VLAGSSGKQILISLIYIAPMELKFFDHLTSYKYSAPTVLKKNKFLYIKITDFVLLAMTYQRIIVKILKSANHLLILSLQSLYWQMNQF